MTQTQEELYNSLRHWERREVQTHIYIHWTEARFKSGEISVARFFEIRESIVLSMIRTRITSLCTFFDLTVDLSTP